MVLELQSHAHTHKYMQPQPERYGTTVPGMPATPVKVCLVTLS